MTPYLTTYGLRVAAAILILIAGRLFANIAKSTVRKLLVQVNVEPSISTVRTYLRVTRRSIAPSMRFSRTGHA